MLQRKKWQQYKLHISSKHTNTHIQIYTSICICAQPLNKLTHTLNASTIYSSMAALHVAHFNLFFPTLLITIMMIMMLMMVFHNGWCSYSYCAFLLFFFFFLLPLFSCSDIIVAVLVIGLQVILEYLLPVHVHLKCGGISQQQQQQQHFNAHNLNST